MGVGAVDTNWNFVLTDYQGNAWGPIVGASERTFAHPLSAMRTCSLTMDLDNPAAAYILNNVVGSSPPLLKVYRRTKKTSTTQLLLNGDISTCKLVNSSAEGASKLSIVACDGMWRLNKRFVGLGHDSLGRGVGYQLGTALSQVDLCYIIADLVNDTNTSTGASGVINGLQGTSIPGYIGPVYAQNIGQLIAQLAAMLGGPDYEIAPLEPSTLGTYPVAQVGTLNTYTTLGSFKQGVLFEYGTGMHNVSSYELDIDRTGQINKAWSLPQGYPDAVAAGDQIISVSDTTWIGNVGVWEDNVPSDVTTIPLRTQLCSDYVTVRRVPRRQFSFVPTVDNPMEYGVDYLPGDIVIARAQESGITVVDGTTRIFGVSLAVGDQDEETVTLTLVPTTS